MLIEISTPNIPFYSIVMKHTYLQYHLLGTLETLVSIKYIPALRNFFRNLT